MFHLFTLHKHMFKALSRSPRKSESLGEQGVHWKWIDTTRVADVLLACPPPALLPSWLLIPLFSGSFYTFCKTCSPPSYSIHSFFSDPTSLCLNPCILSLYKNRSALWFMSTSACHIFCSCWLLCTHTVSHCSWSSILEEPNYCQVRDSWLLADYRHLRYHKFSSSALLWAQKHHSQVWETLILPPTMANTRCFRETRHPVWINMPEFALIRWTKPTDKRWNGSVGNKVQNLTLAWDIFQQHRGLERSPSLWRK